MTHDDVMERIQEAITLHRAGDADAARGRFAGVWAEISPDGDAFHRCVLAHYMADTQDDPRQELTWDLRALQAADALTDERVKEHHASLAIRGFYPSLHLNLAEDYRKIGDVPAAKSHLRLAETYAGELNDDAYGGGVRAALDRCAARLASSA